MEKTRLFSLLVCFIICIQADAQKNKYDIIVTAGGNGSAVIRRDEPLLIRVILVNRQAQSTANWNLAANARLEELERLKSDHKISDSVYRAEKESLKSQMRVQETFTLGSNTQPWTGMVNWEIRTADRPGAMHWSLQLMSNPRPVPTAVLDANAYYTAYFGMDPELMKQVSEGRYVLEARIGEVRSGPLELVIDRRPQTIDSLDQWIQLSKYYWHKGDGDKSLRFAEMALLKKPRSIALLLMKADALCLNRSLLPALEVYNLALEEYYKTAGAAAEPPDYILDMIWAIKNELGGN